MKRWIVCVAFLTVLFMVASTGGRTPTLTILVPPLADSAVVAALADYSDSAGTVADGAVDLKAWYDAIGDTMHLGPWVKIPDSAHWTANGRGGASDLGNLQVFATKAPKAGAAMFGVHIYADTTEAHYPSRLLNLVSNAPSDGAATTHICQRTKVNVETSGPTPTVGDYVEIPNGITAWGTYIEHGGADTAATCNFYSKITSLIPDKDGKTAHNIYTDGGHVKFLDGDTEIESLYVDLDHIVFDSDSIDIQGDTTFVGALVRIPNVAGWPEAALHTIAVRNARLGILASGQSGLYILADSTTGSVPAKIMQIVQPASGANTASQTLLDIKTAEITSGITTGLKVHFESQVTGYPIHISADNTDTGTHANIYSTITNDNGASWNIYADGGRNYFSDAVEIADTLKLTSAKVCGVLACVADGDTAQITSDIIKADSTKAHIFLQEFGPWVGTPKVFQRWDGGCTVISTGDETASAYFSWFVICDP